MTLSTHMSAYHCAIPCCELARDKGLRLREIAFRIYSRSGGSARPPAFVRTAPMMCFNELYATLVSPSPELPKALQGTSVRD